MTFLGLYKFLFTTELLISEVLFFYRLPRRKHFVWRLLGSIALCYLITALLPVLKDYNGWYGSVMFFALFSATFGAALFCFNVPVKNAFLCCLAAYTAQHLAYEIFKLVSMPFSDFAAQDMYGSDIIYFSDLDMKTLVIAFIYCDIYIAVYAATYFIVAKKIGVGGDLYVKNVGMLFLSAAILLVDIMFNAFTVGINYDYNILYDVIISLYNSLCCLLVFYIQYGIITAKDMRDELQTVQNLLLLSQKQYEMRKEEIDLINIKCHDLKHRISDYMSLDDRTAREIEDMIYIYDANVKTQNKVVDIILTEKSLKCHANGITLTCMADCTGLSFMSEGDLYAMFGNILDNAIEAVSRLDDKEKNNISLNIREQAGCISVMCENYYDGNVKLSADGLPQTLKQDKNYHGFGLKSIRAVVEKYGGSLSIKSDGGVFRVNILLPIKK